LQEKQNETETAISNMDKAQQLFKELVDVFPENPTFLNYYEMAVDFYERLEKGYT